MGILGREMCQNTEGVQRLNEKYSSPKNTNVVIIYSLSDCLKSVYVSVLSNTTKDIQKSFFQFWDIVHYRSRKKLFILRCIEESRKNERLWDANENC